MSCHLSRIYLAQINRFDVLIIFCGSIQFAYWIAKIVFLIYFSNFGKTAEFHILLNLTEPYSATGEQATISYLRNFLIQQITNSLTDNRKRRSVDREYSFIPSSLVISSTRKYKYIVCIIYQLNVRIMVVMNVETTITNASPKGKTVILVIMYVETLKTRFYLISNNNIDIYNIGALTVNIECMWRGLETEESWALANLSIRFVPSHINSIFTCQYTNSVFILQ